MPPGRGARPPARHHAGRRLLGIPLSVIVAAELVAAAVLLATDRSAVGAVLVIAAAAVVALLVVLPIGGMRLGTWLAVRLGYATRRRVFTVPPPSSPPATPPASAGEPVVLPGEVRALFPGIVATDHVTRGAGRLGLVQWHGTWTALIAVHSAQPDVLRVGTPPQLPVERIIAALTAAELPLAGVTVVSQAVVGDADRFEGGALAAISGELGPLVRGRRTWLAVRIDPVAAGAALAARGGGAEGLSRLASAAVSRVISEVVAAGLRAESLDAADAGQAMAAALLQPPPADDRPVRWIESLGGVASAQVHHRCFAVTSWPGRPDRPLTELAGATAYGLTIAYEVLGVGDRPRLRGVLRLSATSATQLERASTRLRRAARGLGVGLRPLRAQQAAALRLTIPGGRQ